MEMRFDFHPAGDVSLHYASWGDPEKPLVLCLHGFPEFWGAWREVMVELMSDFHVLAPDQRGYNLSSKPEGIEAYRTKHLVGDIAGFANRFSPDRPFVLCGHDWGASVAYAFAFAHPERISRLVVANGVHPAAFQRAIFEDPEQRQASQYINRLRAPEADERMAENEYQRTFNMIAGFSKTGWMTSERRAEYLEAWSRPDAMSAMLNWYRASPIVVPAPDEEQSQARVLDLPDEALAVHMPHLVLWGEEDEALRPVCLQGLARYAPDLTVRKLAGTGHWVLHERPAEVAGEIRAFVGAG
jgi:pimeloyl-ACP methyl ester carboxylesterase